MLTIRPQPWSIIERGDGLGAAQVAEHLDVHVVPEQLGGDVGQLRRRRLPERLGGAVDEDVDAAERRRRAAATIARTDSSSPVSTTIGMTARPVAAVQLGSGGSSSGLATRAAMTTSQPSPASARATALPMPRLPPVTIARLPVSWRSIGPGWHDAGALR